MGVNYVEILARIRLNLANVDQFLAIACGLADDNPSIGRPVHEAAAEIRSSALLIDHLRSLFCHQQSIEQQQQQQRQARQQLSTSGAPATDNLSYFSYSNKQTLVRAAKSLVANVAKILYLSDEIILKSSNGSEPMPPPGDRVSTSNYRGLMSELSPNGRHNQHELANINHNHLPAVVGSYLGDTKDCLDRHRQTAARAEAAHQQPGGGACHRPISTLSGQQHNRASGIGNMRKMNQGAGGRCQQDATDNLDSNYDDDDADADVDDKRQRQRQMASSQLGDRLDNVANYSQLLRSFGEFSVDLIDLGNCIMLARHSNLAEHEAASRGCFSCCRGATIQDAFTRLNDGLVSDCGHAPEHVGGASLAPQPPSTASTKLHTSSSSYSMNFAQNSISYHSPGAAQYEPGRRDSHRSAGPGDYYQQASHHLENDWHQHQQQPYGRLQHSPLPLANHQQPPPTTPLEPIVGQPDSGDHRRQPTERDAENCHLRAQLQDTLVLFQVNRLIIDRSILLLLSASKCCLRQGQERVSGLEARKSVAVQIRVSISIIMALVKCSVFGTIGTGPQQTDRCVPPLALHETPVPVPPMPMTSASAKFNRYAGPPTSGGGERLAWHKNNAENTCLLATQMHDQHQSLATSQLPYYQAYAPMPAASAADASSMSPEYHLLGRMSYDYEHEPYHIALRQQLASSTQSTINGGQVQVDQHQAAHLPTGLFSGTPTTSMGPLASLDNNCTVGRERQRQHSIAKPSKSGAGEARPMMDIMNHFLLTRNGTPSAHDAIRGFQNLVESFAHVRNQDELARELDRAFGHFGAGRESGTVTDRGGPFGGLRFSRTGAAAAAATGCIEEDEEEHLEWDKENQERPVDETVNNNGVGAAAAVMATTRDKWLPVVLMNKRQLVRALNVTFLGALKQNLVERVHEFTDCAYTKHERRERIVSLLLGIKFLLNKFVKLIYRLRRRVASPSEPLQLSQLRQSASRLVDFCAELDYELQTLVVEHGDELDRSNGELNLLKQMKHHCLVGDTTRARQTFDGFLEQSEQLIELCQQLNQIAPTNKLKITSKSLATWFRLNLGQLVQMAACLSENSHSRLAKDCSWTYMQVWSSFYDDFCQLARQVAYLAHANCDPARSSRVAHHWQQIDESRSNHRVDLMADCSERSQQQQHQHRGDGRETAHEMLLIDRHHSWAAPGDTTSGLLRSAGSVQSLCDITSGHRQVLSPHSTVASGHGGGGGGGGYGHDQRGQSAVGQYDPHNDSPRSLDHYHGFGPNYRRHHDAQHPQFVAGHHQQNHHEQQMTGAGSGHTSSRGSSLMASPSPLQFADDQRRQREYREHQQQVFDEMGEFPDPITPTEVWHSNNVYGGPTSSTSGGSGGPTGNQQQNFFFVPTPMGGFVSPLAPTSISVDPTAPPIEPPSVPARRSAPSSDQVSDVFVDPNDDAVPSGRRHRRVNNATSSSRRPQTRQVSTPPARDESVENLEQKDQVATLEDLAEQQGGGVTAGQRNTSQPAAAAAAPVVAPSASDQQSVASSSNLDKWSDSEADAIVRGARETAQMALSMYQFTRGEGDLNTTQDLFTQAELFAEEANELYKEVRCFSYKVPAGDLKKELLYQLSHIPALVQQLQFTVKNPTVGKAATFAKVDSVIRETKCLMEAVNRVVEATLSCRQHYNMASSSLRKRTRTLSPSYRGEKGGFDFESFDMAGGGRPGGAFGGPGGTSRHGASGASGGMGSEPDI